MPTEKTKSSKKASKARSADKRSATSKNPCGNIHAKCGGRCGLAMNHAKSCWCVPCQQDF